MDEGDMHGQLTDIVDENFGYRPTMDIEALVDTLAEEVPKLRIRAANSDLENERLRAALEEIASVFVETHPGVMAERALMTREQREAFDKMRAAPFTSQAATNEGSKER